MDQTKPIGPGLAFSLITFGLLIDFIQFVLALVIVGWFIDSAIDLLATIGFAIMLYHHGGKILSKRSYSYTFAVVAEFMPFINAIPWWTAFAIYTVVMDKIAHRQKTNPQRSGPRQRKWRV